MYCTNCGKPNVDVARFCSSCGQSILPISTTPWWNSTASIQTASPPPLQMPVPHHTGAPTSVVVSQAGDGDFLTISAAVAAVAPDSQIRVRPGVYHEHVTVTKPVEIVGDGDKTAIVIENLTADCLLLNTLEVTIRNLTLRGGGRASFEGNDAYYDPIENCSFEPYQSVITVKQGQPLIEDCDIVARHVGVKYDTEESVFRPKYGSACELVPGVAGILVMPGASTREEGSLGFTMTSHPVVRRCRILGGDLGITHIPHRSSATAPTVIEDCTFSGQSMAVQVRHIEMRRCHIQGKDVETGVHFYDGLIEDCVLSNWRTGVTMWGNGTGIMRRCRITKTLKKAVNVLAGNWIIEGCVIEDNALVGVRLEVFTGIARIRYCQIVNNKVGIQIIRQGHQTIEECNLLGNQFGSFYPLNLMVWVQRAGNQEDKVSSLMFKTPPPIDSD